VLLSFFLTLDDGQFPNIEYFLNDSVTYGSMYVKCALKHIIPCE
jgi:hypothetical protein